MNTTNTDNRFLNRTRLSLISLCSVISLNAMAHGTGWGLYFQGGLRDVNVKSIDFDGSDAFHAINQSTYSGGGKIEVWNNYGNSGSVKLGLYDANDKNLVIGTLILTQADANGSKPKPTAVPSRFGAEVAGLPYDACAKLNADNVNSWVCYKYIQNTGYRAYLPPSYSEQKYLVMKISNFKAYEASRRDNYGTVNLDLKMVAQDSPAPAPTPIQAKPTTYNHGNWSSSLGYKVQWSPSVVYPLVQHNGANWIACSDTSAGQEPGNQTNGWNTWEKYTGTNCGYTF